MWIWVAIVALLTLFFFGSSREGLRGWKNQENSTDYYGFDIAGSPTTKDVAACASSCAANSSCKLTVSDVSSGTGKCWLKTQAGTISTSSNRFARQFSTVADKGSFRCESNPAALGASNTASVFRFNSNNVANHYPSPEIANFWDPKWDTNDTYVDCTGLTKGASMTKPSVWTLEANTNHGGSDYKSMISTQDECVKECTDTPTCKGFVFDARIVNNAPTNKCWLKSAITAATPLTDVHTYLKSDPLPAPDNWTLFPNSDYAGGGLSTLTGSTMQACTDACKSNTDCKGVVFDTHDDKCYLKKTIGPRTDYNGLHSYLKPMPAPEGWTYEANTDYAGTDLRKIDNSTTEACLTECSKDPACKGFGFDKPSNTCYLASEMSTKTTSNNFDTYLKTAPVTVPPIPAPPGWTLVPDSNYAGGDLSSLTGSTMQACNDACYANAECKGAVFDTLTNKCVLKSSIGTRSVLAGTHSYLKPVGAPAGWTYEIDTDHGGNDIRQIENSTSEACLQACNDDPTCKGFGFDNRVTNGVPKNKCYLKSAISAKSTLTGFNSYVKPAAALPGWTLEIGTNYSENDIKGIDNSSAEACSQACLDLPECMGTVFNTSASKCWIKSALANKTAQSNTNTYIKPIPTPTLPPPEPEPTPPEPTEPPPVQSVTTEGKWTVDSGFAYTGNILKTMTGSNAQSCKAECEKTTYCKGIMVDKVEPATCSLMSDFSGRKASQLVDSYALSNQADDMKGWTSFSYVINGTNDLGVECGKSLDECKTSCKSNSSCKGFAYGDNLNDPTQKQCCNLRGENDGSFLDSRYTTYDISAISPPAPTPAPTPSPTPAPTPEPVKITPENTPPSTSEPVAFNDVSTFLGFNF